LEATLKLMGLEKPTMHSETSTRVSLQEQKLDKAQPRSPRAVEKEIFFSSSRPGSGESPSKGTPLSRLSAAIGSNDQPFGPLSPDITALDLSPELAAEVALKAFDQREAQHVKALSEGQAVPGYTSPPSGSVRRRRASRRVGSGDSERSGSRQDVQVIEELDEGRAPVMRESGSISTLWSIGTSRRSSMDLAPKP
jgi:hypothetical protein